MKVWEYILGFIAIFITMSLIVYFSMIFHITDLFLFVMALISVGVSLIYIIVEIGEHKTEIINWLKADFPK